MATILIGCAGKNPKIDPVAWNIDLQPKFESAPAVEVDVVGVTDSEKPQWEGYAVSRYFDAKDSFRQRVLKNGEALTYIVHKGKPVRVDMKSDIWQKWLDRGCTHLVVLANLPGEPKPGEPETRRWVVSLDDRGRRKKWRTLVVEVFDNYMRVNPIART